LNLEGLRILNHLIVVVFNHRHQNFWHIVGGFVDHGAGVGGLLQLRLDAVRNIVEQLATFMLLVPAATARRGAVVPHVVVTQWLRQKLRSNQRNIVTTVLVLVLE
jgi:hypothetical protein